MKKTILFTGGGTCGHISPNLAMMEYLRGTYNFAYIGTNGMEKQMVTDFGVKFYEIETPKFSRKLSMSLIKLPFQVARAKNNCKKLLKNIQPDIVFSKGGYVAIPVVLAAHTLGIPIISHESDFSMGLANKIIYRYCNVMCTSFDNFSSKKKCVVTGTPLRENFYQKSSTFNPFEKSHVKTTLLFMGGSLGAKAINQFVWDNINDLTSKYNVLHIVGKGNYNKSICSKNYYQTEFSNNIADFYRTTDIVVCRSGSGTIFELLECKKNMILIPLPKDCSRGDQIENALYFKKHHNAQVIMQDELNMQTLQTCINATLKSGPSQKSNLLDAREKISQIIQANIR